MFLDDHTLFPSTCLKRNSWLTVLVPFPIIGAASDRRGGFGGSPARCVENASYENKSLRLQLFYQSGEAASLLSERYWTRQKM